MNGELYCPNCGAKLVHIANAKTDAHAIDTDDRAFMNKLAKTKKLREVIKSRVKESSEWSSASYKEVDFVFCACVNCKRLYAEYGTHGHYMDIIGTLTDAFLALVIGSEIKE